DREARTRAEMGDLEKQTAVKMRALEDDYRKIMLNLGFNVMVLPQDQDRARLREKDYTSRYMPEEYADRLSKSGIATVNHLLPILEQWVYWDEQKRTIRLVGTRGEVPIAGQKEKRPLVDRVKPGHILLGHELHARLGLKRGDTVTVNGTEYRVEKLLK